MKLTKKPSSKKSLAPKPKPKTRPALTQPFIVQCVGRRRFEVSSREDGVVEVKLMIADHENPLATLVLESAEAKKLKTAIGAAVKG